MPLRQDHSQSHLKWRALAVKQAPATYYEDYKIKIFFVNFKNKKYKILLTGGGTGGSVAPLLAVAEELNNPPAPLYKGGEVEFLWLGAKFGPERMMVEKAGLKFRAISGGKWRRYFSLKNLTDIFKIKIGFWQAFFVMLKWRPNLVVSAGSFISVPVVWAAWTLRVPVLIHQQDIRPGLANKLMAPLARVVTVAFEKSLADYGKKAVWTGNPVRQSFKFPISNFQFPINKNLPMALILGGGTGAEAINRLIEQSANELIKFCNVILITGKNKNQNFQFPIANFQCYEFLDAAPMTEAMQLADLVVTRAGMATLSELSSLGKPSIIIPIPDSQQEANAAFFKEQAAAVVVKQKDLTAKDFVSIIKNLLADENMLKKLSLNMGQAMKKGAREKMAKIILEIIK